MPFNTEIAKYQMKLLGISQVKLSGLTGIPQSLISKYLRGEVKEIPYDKIKIIADHLRCNHHWLCSKTTPDDPRMWGYAGKTQKIYDDEGERIKPSAYFADYEPVIEKNVPFKEEAKGPPRGKFRAICEQMEFGDSFIFTGTEEEGRSFKAGMHGAASYNRFSIAFIKLEEGKWRCWKLEKDPTTNRRKIT